MTDYSKGITFSPDVPSLCDDGWLLIGSMSAKPMKGSDVKSDALYYTRSLGNSKNIAWGEKKEACELSAYLGEDGTAINLNLKSWTPSQEERRNKHELPRAIARRADEYFRQTTSRPEIDYRAPKTSRDVMRILTSEGGFDLSLVDYVHGVPLTNKLALSVIAENNPGIDVRTTDYYKKLQEEGYAPQDPVDTSNQPSRIIKDAQYQAPGSSTTQQEKALEGTFMKGN